MMKKSFKKKKDGGTSNYMVEKLMWFGSVFCGLAGLWIFAVIEIADAIRIIFNLALVTEAFDEGLVPAAIDLAVN